MKKQLAFGTGALALALLAGCSTSSTNPAIAGNSGQLNISGTASTSARQAVTVSNANDSALVTSSTDSTGKYSVNVDTTNLKFPLTVTVIRDSDTIVTVIPAPDSLHVRKIEANVSDLTKFAADKAKCDSNFKKITPAVWDSTLKASAGPWLQHADSLVQQKAALNFDVCSDTALTAKLDSLTTQEKTLESQKDSLLAQFQAGSVNGQAFVQKIDTAFAGLKAKADKAPACEARFPGVQGVFASAPDSAKFDSLKAPVSVQLPTCSDSAASALKASFDSLQASFKAGTITQDAFVTALSQIKPTCSLPVPSLPPSDSSKILPPHVDSLTTAPAGSSSSAASN